MFVWTIWDALLLGLGGIIIVWWYVSRLPMYLAPDPEQLAVISTVCLQLRKGWL